MNISEFLSHASLMVLFVIAILGVMSLKTWQSVFYSFALFEREKSKIKKIRKHIQNKKINTCSPELNQEGRAASVIRQAISKTTQLFETDQPIETISIAGGLIEKQAIDSIQAYKKELSKGISTLSTIASTAPYIGLLGTVWGILITFHQIGTMENITMQTLAPYIGEALVATAIGLLVAIPASASANYIIKQSEDICNEMTLLTAQILNSICLNKAAICLSKSSTIKAERNEANKQ